MTLSQVLSRLKSECSKLQSFAETTVVIPANEAAAHIGEYATVEGLVAKVFTSKSGNTFLNIGAAYPNQTFTGWIPPASPVSKSPILSKPVPKRTSPEFVLPMMASSAKKPSDSPDWTF